MVKLVTLACGLGQLPWYKTTLTDSTYANPPITITLKAIDESNVKIRYPLYIITIYIITLPRWLKITILLSFRLKRFLPKHYSSSRSNNNIGLLLCLLGGNTNYDAQRMEMWIKAGMTWTQIRGAQRYLGYELSDTGSVNSSGITCLMNVRSWINWLVIVIDVSCLSI